MILKISYLQCSTLTPARRPMAKNLEPGLTFFLKLVIKSALMANNIFWIKHKCETSWPGWPMAQKVSVDHCIYVNTILPNVNRRFREYVYEITVGGVPYMWYLTQFDPHLKQG